jgi:predicted porin
MKNIAVFLALGGLANVATAQSSVTMYGIIDEGLQFATNSGGKQLWNLNSSNGPSGSRFGFKGSEDLGGGMHAFFALESGLNINTGQYLQGGTPFGRLAAVGLGSNQFGQLSLGRQRDPAFDLLGPMVEANTYGGALAGRPGDLDNLGGTYRVNNTIKYVGPALGGFNIEALYALPGTPGNVTQSDVKSLATKYTFSGFTVAGGYLYAKNPFSGANTSNSTNGLLVDNLGGALPTSRAYSGYSTASGYQVSSLATTYVAGSSTFGLNFSNTVFSGIHGAVSGVASFNSYEANYAYQWGPALSLAAAYSLTARSRTQLASGRQADSTRYNQIAVSGTYSLSKRTSVYIVGVAQRAGGQDSTGAAAVASINGIGNSGNGKQAVVRAGLRHFF